MVDRIIGKQEDLDKVVGQTSSHDIYRCPYCITIIGKKDSEGKLYVNKKSGLGYCFRCESVIAPCLADRLDIDLLFERLNVLYEIKEVSAFQLFNLYGWTTPLVADSETARYIKNRKIDFEIAKRFRVREVSLNMMRKGVVFINELFTNELTDFLQIRNLAGKYRHSGVRSSVKPLAWTSLVENDTIGIVEGFFSGLSVYQASEGSVSPLPLSGKFFRQTHLKSYKTLLKKGVKNVYVILDGGFDKEAMKLCDLLYSVSYGATIFFTKLSNGKDPNDLSKEELNYNIKNSLVFEPLMKSMMTDIYSP